MAQCLPRMHEDQSLIPTPKGRDRDRSAWGNAVVQLKPARTGAGWGPACVQAFLEKGLQLLCPCVPTPPSLWVHINPRCLGEQTTLQPQLLWEPPQPCPSSLGLQARRTPRPLCQQQQVCPDPPSQASMTVYSLPLIQDLHWREAQR